MKSFLFTIIFGCVGVALLGRVIGHCREINVDEYRYIKGYEKYPEVKLANERAMQNGYISAIEFNDIQKLIKRCEVNSIMSNHLNESYLGTDER